MLLISTLTSLKHAGAAFAAHSALQEIATACLSKKLVAGAVTDKVRDSTLRRSTGYALGFLAIMRSEVVSAGPSKLCPRILSSILRLSLPSEGRIRSAFDKLGWDGIHTLTHSKTKDHSTYFVADDEYEVRHTSKTEPCLITYYFAFAHIVLNKT
jgi:Putative death-receptor fusion protein (DUF2428)